MQPDTCACGHHRIAHAGPGHIGACSVPFCPCRAAKIPCARCGEAHLPGACMAAEGQRVLLGLWAARRRQAQFARVPDVEFVRCGDA